MSAARRASGKPLSDNPLWGSGNRLHAHASGSGNRLHAHASGSGPKGSSAGRAGVTDRVDQVDAWMRAHRAPNILRTVSLPDGELDPKTSGVLGAYELLPQATARLFDHFMEVDRAPRAARHGVVPGSDHSGAFLRKVLATPLVHHNFAA